MKSGKKGLSKAFSLSGDLKQPSHEYCNHLKKEITFCLFDDKIMEFPFKREVGNMIFKVYVCVYSYD